MVARTVSYTDCERIIRLFSDGWECSLGFMGAEFTNICTIGVGAVVRNK